ncbi:hypothetical protein HDV06_002233 [Boothiomyces sp. JEL0866]|nr:hypothetical protein HDV06_002233 [Boothiomyces sp. JEL0866]
MPSPVEIKQNSPMSEQKSELTPHMNVTAEAWKVVGSPARRASINPENQPDLSELASPDFTARARAASIPGFSFQVEHHDGPPPPGLGENTSPSSATPVVAYPSTWNGNNGSIWSTGANGSPIVNDNVRDIFSQQSAAETPEISIMTEEEYNAMPKGRSRSKSSSAIFDTEEDPFDPKAMPDMSSIWTNSGNQGQNLLHRRASTQPSQQTLMWEALRAAQLATPDDMNGVNTDELMERFKQEQAANLRRYSVAPSMVNRFMARNVDPTPEANSSVLQVPTNFEQVRRRHSMAGPMFDRKLNTKFLSEGFEALGLNDASQQLERIDDYFENTESRTRAFVEAGKNLQAIQDTLTPVTPSPLPSTTYRWPLYVVEFKAGRTDYFYIPEENENLVLSIGDLAIVEADRGKDLGKVIETSINSLSELQMYQATHQDPLVDSHNAVGKEIQPKRIFRIAEPSEVAMLLSKSQDEAKANGVCQIKIRQKKLPMEIVDAEYQWDRRKLTFYFVADRRIDFRELVRELFKIYKTRIWM